MPTSTSPESRLITLMSQWLAGHVPNVELLAALDEIGTDGLGAAEVEAVDELSAALRAGDGKGELERTVRETLEALALGA